jgi:hypothetical protein
MVNFSSARKNQLIKAFWYATVSGMKRATGKRLFQAGVYRWRARRPDCFSSANSAAIAVLVFGAVGFNFIDQADAADCSCPRCASTRTSEGAPSLASDFRGLASSDTATERRFSLGARVRMDVLDDLRGPLYRLPELKRVRNVAQAYMSEIEAELGRIFRYTPEQRVALRLLSRDQYRDFIGSASWANAVYYNFQITAPLKGVDHKSLRNLRRSLRHEYVHAACAELSASRTPAWIEEGLAQMLEGPVNRALAPAMRKLIEEDGLIPFPLMEDGFTTLEERSVAAAYGQSLFAVRTLVNRFGFSAFREYFLLLRAGRERASAFEEAFGMTQLRFENDLRAQAELWVANPQAAL